MPQPVTRVTNLRVDRIDFVDAGASLDKATGQGAHVLLYKRAGVPPAAKKAPTFDEILLGRQAWEMNDAFYELTCTLSDTISSIIWDPETADKAGAIRAALGSFEAALEGEIADWLAAPASLTKAAAPAQRDRVRDTTRLAVQKAVARALLARKKETDMATKPAPVAKEKPSMDGVPDAVKAYIDELEAKIAEMGKGAGKEPPKPEDVLKGLTPEARALVEKAAADAEAARKESAELQKRLDAEGAARERERWIGKVGKLSALPVKADDLGPALAKLHGLDAEATGLVEKALEAAQGALAANNALLKELGHADAAAGAGETAEGQIAKKAEALVAKGEAKTLPAAIALVAQREPALYAQHVAEQRGKAGGAR
jgi:hypothetical protein